MQSNSWGNTQQRWVSSGFPFTIFVMVAMFLSAILLTIRPDIYASLMFAAPSTVGHPWTFLTYPLLSSAIPTVFTLLFDIGLTYFFCSSLERSWGTKAFALFFASISVVSALSLWSGAVLLHGSLPAENLLPVAGAAVVWAFANAEEQMNLFFIPLRGIYFGAIAVLYIMFNYAQSAGWEVVPFALVGCVAAFAWLKYGITYRIQSWGDGLIPMSRPAPRSASRSQARPKLKLVPDQNKPMDDRFTLRDLNPLEWYAKRKRRKQFEKLVGGDE